MKNFGAILVTGLCFGWLIGMSVSPVMQTVVSSLVALIVALTTVLAGLEPQDNKEEKIENQKVLPHLLKRKVSPIPVMFLLIGTVIGSASGLYTRTHGLFVPGSPQTTSPSNAAKISEEVKMWTDLGMDKTKVIDAVFNKYYTAGNSEPGLMIKYNSEESIDRSKNNSGPDVEMKSPRVINDSMR